MPGFVGVDERRPHTLLAQLERLAAHIPLTGDNNRPAARWFDVFVTDQTFVIAAMMGVDPGPLKAQFEQALGKGEETPAALRLAVALAERLETWRQCLARAGGQTAHELERRLSQTVRRQLVQPLASLRDINARLGTGLNVAAFDGPWLPDDGMAYPSTLSESLSLREAFNALLDAEHDIARTARPYFEESIRRSDHDPAIALLFSFLGLVGAMQTRLNRFTQRHQTFYYRDVLSAAPRAGKPRRLLLSLRRPAISEPLHVPGGTEFTLESSELPQPQMFHSTTDLWISDAEVAMLASECLEKDPKVSPESDLNYVSRVRFGVCPSATDDRDRQPWSPFGQPSDQGQPVLEPTENFGFAVAAPALFLAEGDRRIDLIVQFAEPNAVAAEGSVDGYVAKLLQQIDQTPDDDGEYQASAILSTIAGQMFQHMMLMGTLTLKPTTRQRLLDRIKATPLLEARSAEIYAQLFDADIDSSVFTDRLLSKAFDIALTGPEGWITIDDVRVRRLERDPTMSLRLSVRLSSAAPSVVGYDPDVHGNRLPTTTPVLRCLLSRRANFCAYSMLDDLELQQVTIETQVSVQGGRKRNLNRC